MKNKVVVIGGAGFLGSHVADSLSERELQVRIVDSKPSPWISVHQEMAVGDILDGGFLKEVTSGVDYVYHMAGIADISDAASSPKNTMMSNIIGSINVLDACIANNIKRVLFASTIYVYSDHGSFYRVSKQSVELLIEAYLEKYGLEYTILRYGSLYGTRAQEWNALKRYVREAVTDKLIQFKGTGEERREYIHVLDAARLSVMALDPKYANKCLTLTGSQVYKTKELIEMIREVVGTDVKVELCPNDRDHQHYALTPYKYTPRRGIKIIADEFIDIGQGILDLVEETDHNHNGN